MLEALGEDSQSKRLDLRDRFVPALPIRHHARQVRNLGQPATVVLSFQLDGKLHRISTHRPQLNRKAYICLTKGA